MKSINCNLFFAIMLVQLFVLIGCNSGNNEQASSREISVGDLKYKLTKASFGANVIDHSQPDTSNRFYLLADLTLINNYNHPIKFDSTHFELIDASGKSFPYSIEKEKYFKSFKESLNNITINSKGEKSGFIIFNVPGIDTYRLRLSSGDLPRRWSSLSIAPPE